MLLGHTFRICCLWYLGNNFFHQSLEPTDDRSSWSSSASSPCSFGDPDIAFDESLRLCVCASGVKKDGFDPVQIAATAARINWRVTSFGERVISIRKASSHLRR